jgi:predicted NUDIX family NTP pyrophosphohydrolase
MAQRMAGILLIRRAGGEPEVLLVHPGGASWAERDLGVWSIPMGEAALGDDPRERAASEFTEQLGTPAPTGDLSDLGEVRRPGGHIFLAFALERGADDEARLGFGGVDRVAWFGIEEARERILPAQVPFLDRLEALLAG